MAQTVLALQFIRRGVRGGWWGNSVGSAHLVEKHAEPNGQVDAHPPPLPRMTRGYVGKPKKKKKSNINNSNPDQQEGCSSGYRDGSIVLGPGSFLRPEQDQRVRDNLVTCPQL